MNGRRSIVESRGKWSTRFIRDVPLFWKMLVPFLIAIVLVGAVGTFTLVRNLAQRAQADHDAELTGRSLGARSLIHDRELSLLESASLAANLSGMREAVQRNDETTVDTLLQSVLALKVDLTVVAVTNRSGRTLSEFSRREAGTTPLRGKHALRTDVKFVNTVLHSHDGRASAGFASFGDRSVMALAVPICEQQAPCAPLGAAIVGVDGGKLVTEARVRSATGENEDGAGVALFDTHGRLIGRSDGASVRAAPDPGAKDFVRKHGTIDGVATQTLYSPIRLQGQPSGTLAVTLGEPRLSSVRAAAFRIVLLLLAAMVAVIAVGAGVSRFVLRQMRAILETNRRLAEGDLSARAPVLGSDEHGELAKGLNQMADALEESYKTLEAKVEHRTAELGRVLQERTDFFAAVSHEFRTPLAVILGQAQMLSNPTFPKDGAWHRQSGEILTDAANQLLTFVNDILEIAKAESGRVDITVEDVRLAELLGSLEPAIKSLARGHGLTLTVHRDGRVPMVRADRTRVQEIVLNLVDNAVKYTPKGGQIDIALTRSGAGAIISVTDTGIGIPADALDRIYDPFYRVKDTETQDGQPSSGLGLALVKRLAEAQGGTVSVRSDPGEGSTFTVWLPAARRGDRRPTRKRTRSAIG